MENIEVVGMFAMVLEDPDPDVEFKVEDNVELPFADPVLESKFALMEAKELR